MVRAGAGVSIVNPRGALDYAAGASPFALTPLTVKHEFSATPPRLPPRWLTPSVSILKHALCAPGPALEVILGPMTA